MARALQQQPAHAIVIIAACMLRMATAALARVRVRMRMRVRVRLRAFLRRNYTLHCRGLDCSGRKGNRGSLSISANITNRINQIIGLLISLGNTLSKAAVAAANRNVTRSRVAQVHGNVLHRHIARYQNAVFAKALRGHLRWRSMHMSVLSHAAACYLYCRCDVASLLPFLHAFSNAAVQCHLEKGHNRE